MRKCIGNIKAEDTLLSLSQMTTWADRFESGRFILLMCVCVYFFFFWTLQANVKKWNIQLFGVGDFQQKGL